MLQDFERNRPPEIDGILTAVQAFARAAEVPTPQSTRSPRSSSKRRRGWDFTRRHNPGVAGMSVTGAGRCGAGKMPALPVQASPKNAARRAGAAAAWRVPAATSRSTSSAARHRRRRRGSGRASPSPISAHSAARACSARRAAPGAARFERGAEPRDIVPHRVDPVAGRAPRPRAPATSHSACAGRIRRNALAYSAAARCA